MPNRVLGIDPGFDRLGLAILHGSGQKQELLHSECVTTSAKEAHETRLLKLGTRVREVIRKWQPESIAIEKLFFNQNTTSALKVAEARGTILFLAAEAGLSVYEYSPQDVKIAVTGYGKADKKSVWVMVSKLVQIKTKAKKLDDELDAIAVGITHLASRKLI